MHNNDHPLAIELNSLRVAVARFQEDAHAAELKLQRFSLDSSNAHDKLVLLSRENALLKSELAILRANSSPEPSANIQSQQLTLSLRHLSDKLTLTEHALLDRTNDLVQLQAQAAKAKLAEENAYALAARARGFEEEARSRERQLRTELYQMQEAAQMTDLVLNEYADLVRTLEGRSPAVSSGSDNLSEGKYELQKLFSEFSAEIERLNADVAELQTKLVVAEAKAESEKQASEMDRIERTKAQVALETLKRDDNTAAKMVARYMKFSQASTDSLQTSLQSLKARHAATIDTLTKQITSLESRLRSSQAATERMRNTLDDLGKDIMREMFGRRREVALRVRLLSREERLQEGLRRLARKIEEHGDPPSWKTDIEALLSALDGDADSFDGSHGRLISAQAAIDGLIQELQTLETRSIELQKRATLSDLKLGETSHNSNSERSLAEKPLPTLNHEESPSDGFMSTSVANGAATATKPANGDAPSPPPNSMPIVEEQVSISAATTLETNSMNDTHSSEAISLSSADSAAENAFITEEAPTTEVAEDLSAVSSGANTPEVGGIHAAEAIPFPTADTLAVSSELSNAEAHSGVTHPTANASEGTVDASDGTAVPAVIPSLSAEISDPTTEASGDPSTVSTPQLNIDVALPTASIVPPSPTSLPTTPEDQPRSLPHPLLHELKQSSGRYDHLQRAFRDCHLSIQDLTQSLSATGAQSSRVGIALKRLDDYTEDARVELEIRVVDEMLLAKGFEVMLGIPSDKSDAPALTPTIGNKNEVEEQVRAFISGEDPAVKRAIKSLERKLEDIEHDIVVLKRLVHEQEEQGSVVSPFLMTDAESDGMEDQPSAASWTSWLPMRTAPIASPLSGKSVTFGHVMTSPKLRHSSSVASISEEKQPFEDLGLRVAMSPRRIPSDGARGMRPRTISTGLYMLGLGSSDSSNRLAGEKNESKSALETDDVE